MKIDLKCFLAIPDEWAIKFASDQIAEDDVIQPNMSTKVKNSTNTSVLITRMQCNFGINFLRLALAMLSLVALSGCDTHLNQLHQYHLLFSDGDQEYEIRKEFRCELDFTLAESDPGPYWQLKLPEKFAVPLQDGTKTWVKPEYPGLDQYCVREKVAIDSGVFFPDPVNYRHLSYVSNTNNKFHGKRYVIKKSELLYTAIGVRRGQQNIDEEVVPGPAQTYYYITLAEIPMSELSPKLQALYPQFQITALRSGANPYMEDGSEEHRMQLEDLVENLSEGKILLANSDEVWSYPGDTTDSAIDLFLEPEGFPNNSTDPKFIKKIKYKNSVIDFLASFNKYELLFDKESQVFILIHAKRLSIGVTPKIMPPKDGV